MPSFSIKPSTINVCAAALTVFMLIGCAPTHREFLTDASATCGRPDLLFPSERTYATPNRPDEINTTYDCVQHYLHASPEYQAAMAGKDNDAGYIDALRRVDLARGAGQITADEAKAESAQLYQRYRLTVGE